MLTPLETAAGDEPVVSNKAFAFSPRLSFSSLSERLYTAKAALQVCSSTLFA